MIPIEEHPTVALASDHGGYALKEAVKAHLEARGCRVEDFGCHGPERCDYPDFGIPAARAVAEGKCRFGVVICTTGIGMSMAANKVRGVRCALCHDPWAARMTRSHNDANVLALGAQMSGPLLAQAIVDAFLDTPFSRGENHVRRVAKVMAAEDRA